MDFETFRNLVIGNGGIWETNAVHFGKSNSSYLAIYSPSYPIHTIFDRIIEVNYVQKTCKEIGGDIYWQKHAQKPARELCILSA